MTRTRSSLLLILAVTLATRLLAMFVLPLVETTEPRYAEIARLMASTGDWITPWFAPDVPFWGKPPLSFWAQAGAIRLLGSTEFAVRLPAMLASLATMVLIYLVARPLTNPRTALLSTVIYTTSALGFAMTGAVLTDPFLVFSLTLAICAAIKTVHETHPGTLWRYGLFIGTALGLLAKGPLALVLLAPPILVLLMTAGRDAISRFPWLSGTLLTLVITLPWYIAAEIKTPGFIDYFIIGEHIKRFVDAGWQGDLYGKAHDYPRGTIWLFALWAFFPWWLAPLLLLFKGHRLRDLCRFQHLPYRAVLIVWLLWPLVFFSAAGNILWTYALPSLPAFSIVTALVLTADTSPSRLRHSPFATPVLAAVVPITGLLLLAGYNLFNLEMHLNTERSLLAYHHRHNSQAPLYYLDRLPFSARFYSHGQAQLISLEQLDQLMDDPISNASYIAIPRRSNARTDKLTDFALPLFRDSRYALYSISTLSVNGAMPSPTQYQDGDRVDE